MSIDGGHCYHWWLCAARRPPAPGGHIFARIWSGQVRCSVFEIERFGSPVNRPFRKICHAAFRGFTIRFDPNLLPPVTK